MLQVSLIKILINQSEHILKQKLFTVNSKKKREGSSCRAPGLGPPSPPDPWIPSLEKAVTSEIVYASRQRRYDQDTTACLIVH